MKIAASLLLAAATVVAMASSGYPSPAVSMAGIFVLAGAFWVTEAVPLFVTALLAVGLQIVALANPGDWPFLGFPQGQGPTMQAVVNGAADPVLLLFLGGFMLARAAERVELGGALVAWLLSPFAAHPARLLLGVMLVTATFSLWMSNTATTVMMLAVIGPLLATLREADPYRKALVLAVPFAASIGGLGTPISSPPNAVAVGYLLKAGYSVTFLDWMLVSIPLMVGLLLITWLLLWWQFPAVPPHMPLAFEPSRLTPRAWFVVAVFSVTVALWLTGAWHGLPAAVVAFVPIVVLPSTGILNERDVNGLDWTVLILIAGGVSLGVGMQMSGLDDIVVGWLPIGPETSARVLAAILVATVLVVGTFMSNTAVANLLLPVGISAGLASPSAGAVVEVTMSIALAASLTMALPISTPPNAVAYARGFVDAREMAAVGITVGAIGAVLIVAFGGVVMRFWGVV